MMNSVAMIVLLSGLIFITPLNNVDKVCPNCCNRKHGSAVFDTGTPSYSSYYYSYNTDSLSVMMSVFDVYPTVGASSCSYFPSKDKKNISSYF
jgi:hypothetical protein